MREQLQMDTAAGRWADALKRLRCLVALTRRHCDGPLASSDDAHALLNTFAQPTHETVASLCGAVAVAWGAGPDAVIRYVYTGRVE